MILTAFLLGMLGSLHCIGMCGPIAFLLPIDRKSKLKRIMQIVIYHFGRLTTYAILGSFFGFLGKNIFVFGAQQQISIIIGVLMILIVVLPKSMQKTNTKIASKFYKWVHYIKKYIGIGLKNKSLDMFFMVGFFNGLLPCGLVYMAIFGALAMGNVWQGGLYMLFFGLGTVPLMTVAIYLTNIISISIRKKIGALIPVFVCIIGLLFILRGMGLGIKYISPTTEVSKAKVSSKYNCY